MSTETKAPMSRDELRSSIFGEARQNFRSETTQLWGHEVEFRQPTLGQVLRVGQTDPGEAMLRMIIDYVYVPGTTERLFEDGDIDVLRSMPYDAELNVLADIVTKLTGVDVEEAEKN